MDSPLVIHVVDHDHKRRAQIARCAFALGHHAEVYSGRAELAAALPKDGLIIALEDALEGGVPELVGLVNRDGRWLAIVATSTTPTVEKAVEAVRLGAVDYVKLPIETERLAETIAKAANESTTYGKRIRRRYLARRRLSALSARERGVVALVAQGLTNKEMGRTLGLSPRTIEIHRTNALTKLFARHTAEAIRIWFEAELDDEGIPSDLPAAGAA